MIFNKTILIATAVALVYSESVAAAAPPAAAPAAPPAAPPAVPQSFAVPTSNFAWKNEYPFGLSKPTPKPEWLALIKDDPAMQIVPNVLTAGKKIYFFRLPSKIIFTYAFFFYRWYYSKR